MKIQNKQKIPKDWEKTELDNFVVLSKKKFNPQKSQENFSCIEMEDIEQKTGKLLKLSDLKEKKSIKNHFYKNEVLFGKLRPYLKKFYYSDFEGVCSTEIWILKNKENSIAKFIFNLVQTNRFDYYANKTTGSKMPRADWSLMKNISFLLPPLPEQKRIVGVLEVWDEVLEKLKRKIEIKKNFKKGLIQGLLTGKRRIDGFAGEWEVKKLGDYIENIGDGGTPPRNDKNNFGGDIKWIVISDIKQKIFNTKEKLTNLGFKKSSTKLWKKDSIILSSGATIGEVGVLEVEATTKQGITGIELNEQADKWFIYYLLKNNKNILLRYAQGGTFKEIRPETTKKLKFNFPSLEEQKAIADILMSADEELRELLRKQKLLEEQKRFLLNNLISGEVRVGEMV